MKDPSIAIYGGTFAPVHYGHLAVLEALARQTDIGRIYVMPTNIPPHKRIDFDDDPMKRAEMLRLAVKGIDPGDRIEISDYELKKEGPSYTYLTLTYFSQNVSPDITFVCGADMFATLPRWKRSETIFRLARIAYAERPGVDLSGVAERYVNEYGARLLRLEIEPRDCSSTMIRRLAAEGRDVSEYTPLAVAEYIRDNRLYRSGS